MDIATFVVTVLGFLVSAGPMLVQAIRFVKGSTKYDALQATLEKEKKRLTHLASEQKIGWERIMSLLDSGDMIMPHVVARFWRRIGLLVAAALGTAAFAGKEFHWHEWRSPGDIATICLVLANWILPFASFLKTDVFNEDEKRFLKNFGILHDIFYEAFVFELIVKFNNRCEESITVSDKAESYEGELQGLINKFVIQFKEQKDRFEGSSKKLLPAAPSAGALPGKTEHDSRSAADRPSDGGKK